MHLDVYRVSVEVPHLRKVSMPTRPPRTTASDDEPDYESNIEELNTTKEDDYDSVDEFIESFKSKHMLPLEEEEEDMKQVLRQSVQLRSSVASSISLSHIERQIALQQRQVSFHSNVKSSTSTPGNTQRKAGSGKSTSNTLKKKKKAPTPSYLAPYAMSLGSGRR